MRDINKISKEKDEIIKDIIEVSTTSGANIIQVEKEMEKIKKRAKENMEKLSLLL